MKKILSVIIGVSCLALFGAACSTRQAATNQPVNVTTNTVVPNPSTTGAFSTSPANRQP